MWNCQVVFGNSSGPIWGLVQRAMDDAGFNAAPTHVAILDKEQRSVKGLNSGSESVVTVDLILTARKPDAKEKATDARELRNGDTNRLIAQAISELPLAIDLTKMLLCCNYSCGVSTLGGRRTYKRSSQRNDSVLSTGN
jgi:hypothetical protein